MSSYNTVLGAWPGEVDLLLSDGVRGRIPEELVGGCFWSNGPGRILVNGRRIHPFDGNGYLRAIRLLSDGKVRVQAKMVETETWKVEREPAQIRAGGLATLPPGGWFSNLRAPWGRNVANTCVLPWAGKILALWEGGPPHAVDPVTLRTLGPEHFSGALSPKDAFLAHTRWDARNNVLVGLSPKILGPAVEFTVRTLDARGVQIGTNTGRLDAFTVAHDFAITENYCVILDSSVDFSGLAMAKAMLRLGTILDAVQFSRRNARVMLLPRTAGPSRIVELDRPMLAVHHANAWEEADGTVVLLTCGLSDFAFGREFGWQGPEKELDPLPSGPAQVVYRIEVPPTGAARVKVLTELPLDFPRVRPERDGLPTETVWGMITRKEQQMLCGLGCYRAGATEAWYPGPEQYVGEPLVVPRSEREADCWVLAMLYDEKRSRLAIFDGEDIVRGPVTEIHLPLLFPYGFHGCWQPQTR